MEWLHMLILGSYLVSKNDAIKCYVCGDTEDDSISCSLFRKEDPQFSKECEEGSRSCHISRKANGNIILRRSCETLPLDDCKTANSIEFCYCTQDLCNKINLVDDEDGDDDFMVEGSGIGNRKNEVEPRTELGEAERDARLTKDKKKTGSYNESIGKTVITSSGSYCPSIGWTCYLFWIFIFTSQLMNQN